MADDRDVFLSEEAASFRACWHVTIAGTNFLLRPLHKAVCKAAVTFSLRIWHLSLLLHHVWAWLLGRDGFAQIWPMRSIISLGVACIQGCFNGYTG